MIAWLLTQEMTPHWAVIAIMSGCQIIGFMVGKHVYYGRYKAR